MRSKLFGFFCLLFLIACNRSKVEVDFYSTDLFKQVQLQSIFPDSKTFVDCTPKRDLQEILEMYEMTKMKDGFSLRQFVLDNFTLPRRPQSSFMSDTTITLEQHLTNLWTVLTRKPDEYEPNSSLIPLPFPYVVPGGRFSEVYYWDSYFTLLGLKTQQRYELFRDMVSNFSFLIDSLGFIPNGNRDYYLSRSQPPFFSLMIRELESIDSLAPLNYLAALEKEYHFWMRGSDSLNTPGDALNHVVMLSNGAILNRYWDYDPRPRPEAFKEDSWLAEDSERDKQELFRNLRAAAESGWDFSSRWFEPGKGLESIQTTELVPVDLNCLLFHLENMIARGYDLKRDEENSKKFRQLADQRRRAILTFCWSPEEAFFFDYNFMEEKLSTIKTLAGVYPLFFGIARPEMAMGVADVIQKEFLKPGGLTTTLNNTGEQWDAPNGWAPLHWMTCQGLRNFDIDDLADEIEKRWMRQNIRVFKATGKMMEKYNVSDTTLLAGGGEYPNQDGFGWTNGVALAFIE